MNREQFIKQVSMGIFGLRASQPVIPYFSIYSEKELMGLVKIPLINNEIRLRKEPGEHFLLMKNDASKAGFDIRVVSGFRSYGHQKRIWTRKYKKYSSQGLSPEDTIKKIIEYSTIPGTSRHHWGTDLDIIDAGKSTPSDPLEAKHFEKKGIYADFKQWLTENANRYGFYEVYTNNPKRKGFKYEPWHFSYLPLAKIMLKEYLKIDIKTSLKKHKLYGSNHFTKLFIEQYKKENILGINKKLLEE